MKMTWFDTVEGRGKSCSCMQYSCEGEAWSLGSCLGFEKSNAFFGEVCGKKVDLFERSPRLAISISCFYLALVECISRDPVVSYDACFLICCCKVVLLFETTLLQKILLKASSLAY